MTRYRTYEILLVNEREVEPLTNKNQGVEVGAKASVTSWLLLQYLRCLPLQVVTLRVNTFHKFANNIL